MQNYIKLSKYFFWAVFNALITSFTFMRINGYMFSLKTVLHLRLGKLVVTNVSNFSLSLELKRAYHHVKRYHHTERRI